MGGKKKAAAKKGDDEGDDPKDVKKTLQAAVDCLQMKLVLEQERRDKALTSEKNIQDNEKDLLDDLKTQKRETKDCVIEMTTQYKLMEDRL